MFIQVKHYYILLARFNLTIIYNEGFNCKTIQQNTYYTLIFAWVYYNQFGLNTDMAYSLVSWLIIAYFNREPAYIAYIGPYSRS